MYYKKKIRQLFCQTSKVNYGEKILSLSILRSIKRSIKKINEYTN